MLTPRGGLVRLFLAPGGSLRALELTLDSLLGQTDGDFVLAPPEGGLDAAAAALLARYGEARFLADAAAVADDGAGPRLFSFIDAGTILAPTWLARMRHALLAEPAAMAARCRVTLFDGIRLTPADAETAAAARQGVLWRAPAAAWRALRDSQTPPEGCVTVADRLAIIRTPRQAAPVQRRLPMRLFGVDYVPSGWEEARPPTLHVVVDTEAEFDWQGDFTPDLQAVSALSMTGTAQAVFDRYGLRPVYLIDYPVATQAEGIHVIGAMAARGACAVGAHLHPWTNPPLGRKIDARLSYPGNLPQAEEAAKLATLVAAITANFGEAPVFYKAGRYGLGPNTARLIAGAGFRVDYSLMAETDLRDRFGPDFRAVAAYPYEVPQLGLLAMPMTRADLGPLSQYWQLRQWLDSRSAAMLHVRGVLARTGLMERLTLTPEGVTAELQIVLLRTLMARGHRSFVLHYHSPSLAAGHTEYVRNEAERVAFLRRIETVCRWFFEELGGVPGRPWDLLPVELRKR